jgi:hypothetical protein
MKKSLLLSIACSLIFGLTNVSAQVDVEPIEIRNVLKFKPFSFEFAYERALNKNFSIQVASRFLPIGIDVEDNGESFRYNNYRIIPEARIFVANRKVAPEGFFIAPHLKFGYTTMKAEVESASDLTERVRFNGTHFGAGVTLGWQWIMKSGFSIDTQFGWGYTNTHFNDVKVRYSDGTSEIEAAPISDLTTYLPRIGFSIGYAF